MILGNFFNRFRSPAARELAMQREILDLRAELQRKTLDLQAELDTAYRSIAVRDAEIMELAEVVVRNHERVKTERAIAQHKRAQLGAEADGRRTN